MKDSALCAYCGADFSAPIVQRWELWIPLEPPSQNVVAANKGGGRHAYRKFRESFYVLVMAEARRAGIPKATGLRRVLMTRIFSSRGKPRDRGNLIGGMKPLVDALHLSGVIVDDAEQWLADYYYQRRGETPGVQVVVEDLGGVKGSDPCKELT